MTIDMSKYLGIFLSESTEHLEAFGRELVQLEKDPGPDTIDSMFRHAHSVKGMAASMGFEPIATLAHRVEDIVDLIRSDRQLLTQELADLLLAAADLMQSQVKSAGAGLPIEEGGALLQQLGDRLAALSGRPLPTTRVAKAVVAVAASGPAANTETSVETNAAVPKPPEKPPEAVVPEQLPGGTTRFTLRLKIAASCQVPGVRAFLVHKRLSGLGTLLDLKPSLDDLKGGRIPDGNMTFELETTKGESSIVQALKNVPEVELVSCKGVAPASEASLQAANSNTAGTAASGMPAAAAQAGGSANASAGAAEAAAKSNAASETARTVRVRTEILDYFLDTVGELLLATARIREVGKTVPANIQPVLEESVYRLHGLVKDLHDKVMSVRMTPLSFITDRLPRAARDIARRRGREVDLIISGAQTELDRAIIDDLADPLLHILRNCIDHGLESPEDRTAVGKPVKGRVSISVRRHRDRVVMEIEDDGRGMDAERLKAAAVERGVLTAETAARMTDKEAFMLACLPGVSTATNVSEISGRGVGMDAVKRTVESVGGTLEIESERGKGTRFVLRLPLTVAVVQLLLVQVGAEVFGLPTGKVLGALEADASSLSRSQAQAVLPYGTSLLPVYELGSLLDVASPPRAGMRPYVVMEGDTGKVALAVDRLLGQEEGVLKALSRPLDLIPGLSGVTILGTGRPVFILDVPRLLAA